MKGYYAQLNTELLNFDYNAITFVRTKYGKDYHIELGKKIAESLRVWGSVPCPR